MPSGSQSFVSQAQVRVGLEGRERGVLASGVPEINSGARGGTAGKELTRTFGYVGNRREMRVQRGEIQAQYTGCKLVYLVIIRFHFLYTYGRR